MLRVITIAALALFAVMLMGTDAVQANTWTGCVTPGGTIIHLAFGDSPAKPCGPRQDVIHLDSAVARQHNDANYNHAKVCEAFRSLANTVPFDDILTQMGCPSVDPHLPAGTLRQITAPTMIDNNYSVCDGAFKIEHKDEWGAGYHYAFYGDGPETDGKGGGFVAKSQKLYFDGGQEECKLLCENDPECIGAYWNGGQINEGEFLLCETFHYSHKVEGPWNILCGWDPGYKNGFGCGDELTSALRLWVKCEDDNWPNP